MSARTTGCARPNIDSGVEVIRNFKRGEDKDACASNGAEVRTTVESIVRSIETRCALFNKLPPGPGDVIRTGASARVGPGMKPQVFLKRGDFIAPDGAVLGAQ